MDPDDSKLKDMQAQIDALRAKTAPKPARATKDAENMSQGLRAGTELLGAIGGAGLIGYALDRWLGTTPWLLIILLILGVGTGFLNVWKTTQNIGTTVGYKKSGPGQK
ncbi:MAG: AtpZ/AtpI family protein [Alphaproteobacteria bacterium]|nr:AtpZ/AtpI family protein [Alphaproteobacteria bacterium]USO07641.1 MAG: AtpZ/AtpI family protein [Rhodospirillales bacterium]